MAYEGIIFKRMGRKESFSEKRWEGIIFREGEGRCNIASNVT
jgi:hypothetical protein